MKHISHMENNRLENSRFFFLKISKEIGKAWRKSLTRAKRAVSLLVSLSVFSLVPDLLFDCSRVLEYAKIRTVLQSRKGTSCKSLLHSLKYLSLINWLLRLHNLLLRIMLQ